MSDTVAPPAVCPGCGGTRQPHQPLCGKCHSAKAPDKTPVGVNWPRLVATVERRGVPVSRVDEHGRIHIIRTTAQLREEWQ